VKVTEQTIKDLLFKEAKAKREYRIRAEQNNILFVEASEHMKKISTETQFLQNEAQKFGPSNEISDYEPKNKTQLPTITPTTPPEEQKIKPMPQEPLSFLQKRKNDKRRLFRERTRILPPEVTSTLGSIEERLLKAANRLDEHGEVQVANKIDILLQKLCEVDHVRKTSRLQTN